MYSQKRIMFDGIKKRGDIPYIIFTNEKGVSVEIPIELKMAKHIELYLAKIAGPSSEEKISVERGNMEEEFSS